MMLHDRDPGIKVPSSSTSGSLLPAAQSWKMASNRVLELVGVSQEQCVQRKAEHHLAWAPNQRQQTRIKVKVSSNYRDLECLEPQPGCRDLSKVSLDPTSPGGLRSMVPLPYPSQSPHSTLTRGQDVKRCGPIFSSLCYS